MNDIQIYKHPQFGKIRTVMRYGEPWFVGKDLTHALGYDDAFGALKKHVDDDDKLVCKIDNAGQRRDATIVNEPGMYALIFTSNLKRAREFKRWMTSEVLPSIRKTAMYMAGRKPLIKSDDRLTPESLKAGRKLLGLTQKQLGDLCGTSRETIANWETGRIPNDEHSAMLKRAIQEESRRQARAIENAIKEQDFPDCMSEGLTLKRDDDGKGGTFTVNKTAIVHPMTENDRVARGDALCQSIMKSLQSFKCQSKSEVKARLNIIAKVGVLMKLF